MQKIYLFFISTDLKILVSSVSVVDTNVKKNKEHACNLDIYPRNI